jgi:hypothetical protein
MLRGNRVNLLRWIILLQLATTLVPGQPPRETNPSTPPNQPDALVRSLYAEVVTRHPLGVPSGADWKTFAPYLSKALLHRIDVNLACQEDWSRQNPDPNSKPPFLEDGLFTGGNERAEPRSFHIERTESEKDGSIRVYLRLALGSTPADTETWHIAVIVLRENGRLVVDNVIYLKDEKDESGVDYRLSEYLSYGCDGPRWVGDRDQQK